MRRRVLLGVSWLIATVVSTTVAWQAVALVGRQVTGDERAGRAVAVTTPSSPAAPSPSSDTTAGTTAVTTAGTTGTAPAEVVVGPTQAFNLAGGSVGVRCEGTSIALQWATPAAGYTMDVRDAGPDEVDVRFEAGDRESRLRADCASGALVAEPDEDSD